MKLSSAIVLASMATSAAASTTVSGKNAAKVLKAARRLDEEGDDAAEEDEYAYLMNYSLKMIGCKAGETVQNAETGEYEYGAALFRLCPTSSGCDSESVTGCTEGFGDYVVGLNTFVDAFFEDQRDNYQWDDQFEVDRYAECAEYEVEEAEDDANNVYANYAFYIGPACTEDEQDIKLALFQDETCTYAAEFSFEEISNGFELPFSTGGMVSTYCQDCVEANDDGEYEARDMCMQLVEETAYACEENMEQYSQYGLNEAGCESIAEMLPASAKESSSSGKLFGIIVVVVVALAAIGYVAWWRQKKSSGSDGLVA